MPIVTIAPRDEEVLQALASRMADIRPRLKEVICSISGFPEDEVIVRLIKPDVVDPDPCEADFVVYADTCPHVGLEASANRLCEAIAMALIRTRLNDAVFEVWPRFLPGPWALVRNGEIVDTVSHPRYTTET